MPYNGSGSFSLVAGNPVVTGTTISSTTNNNTLSDIANNGLSYALTKDGQQTPTANIPMGSFRITGLGAATARTDAIQYAQVQDSAPVYLTSVSGTNTVTATAAASMAAYATGQKFHFIPANTNSGATTLNLNSIGAKSVFYNGAACVGGEIKTSVPATVVYDGTQFNLVATAAAALSTTNMAHFQDQETTGTNGGTFTSGAWRTRVLNTTVTNNIGATLSTNAVTLAAGTYYVEASAPGYQCGGHKTRIQQTSGTPAMLIGGTSEQAGGTADTQTRSWIFGKFTLSTSQTIELQHQCGSTSNTIGLGVADGFSQIEVYADLRIWKIS